MEEEVTVDELKAAIRKGTIACQIHPVFVGSSYKNKGVQELLDAVVDYMPSPIDVPAIKGTNPDTGEEDERPSDVKAPFSALAFKIMTDPFVGKLTYLRVYSGQLDSGSYVSNASKGKKERIGRLLQMHSNQRVDIDGCAAGDIVAVVGLKDTSTGDTLCDADHPIILESMEFAENDHPRAQGVRRAGHRHRRRAEDEGRAGQDGHRAAEAGRGGPDVPRVHQPGDRPDHHRRHGRAAPRDHRRPPAARVQGRGERGQAPGRLPRDGHAGSSQRRGQVRAPVRRSRPVRPCGHQPDPAGSRQGLRVREQDRGRRDPQGVHHPDRQGHPGSHQLGRACGLPGRGHQDRAHRRFVPRRRLLRGGVQGRRFDGGQGCAQEGRSGPHGRSRGPPRSFSSR